MMATSTPLNGLPWPQPYDPADIPGAIQNLANALDTRLVMRFASTTARDQVITTPVAGMLAFAGTTFTYYTGSAWVVLLQDQPFALYLQTSAQSIPSTTLTAITFPAPSVDTNAGYKAANPSRYTPTVPGYYQVSGQICYSVDTTGGRCLNLTKNGTIGFGQNAAAAIPSTYYNTTVSATGVAYFNGTTDYLEMYAHQNTAGALTTIANSTQLSILRVHS
jgi:hypothetical protein